MARKSAAATKTPAPAPNWDKWVSAAYLRMIGHTQKQAAEAVGRSERALREWEADGERWPRAQEEARGRWLNAATDAARGAVLRSLQVGNAELGKWLLERVDPHLAPPKMRLDVQSFDPTKLSDEQLERIAAGEAVAQVIGDGRDGSRAG